MKVRYLIITLITAMIIPTQALAGEVVTFDRTIKTEVLSISKRSGKLMLKHSAGEIDCIKIFSVAFRKGVKESTLTPQVNVILTSGDLLKGNLLGSTEEKAVIETEVMGNVSIMYEGIRAIFFPAHIESQYATYVEHKLAIEAESQDVVFLSTGHDLKGGLMMLDLHDLEMEVEEGGKNFNINIKYRKTACILLFQEFKPKPIKGICAKCYLADGCVISGEILKYAGNVLQLKTPLTGELKIPSKNIVRLVFRGVHFKFLSDQPAFNIKETPYIQTPGKKPAFFYSMKRDKTVYRGNTIKIRGRVFRKGLGMIAQTEASFRLDGKYKTFSSTIGLDDDGVFGYGLVDFILKADGKEIYRREKVTMKMDPIRIKKGIAGVKVLTLIVAFHHDPEGIPDDKRRDSGSAENFAVWGNALVRK